MIRFIPLLLIILLTSGCFGSKIVDIKADPVERTIIHPPLAAQLSMRNVEWTVFNREKIEKLLADYPDQEVVLFALSAKGYENLSLNMAEIIRYLKEQKNVIIYYRGAFLTAKEFEEAAAKPEE
ncbi:hypothetical protein KAR91_30645 [Candidatus Pacearchaeota archaeon]|nr:hypothetical protein [Candidatus Pacearchaeota archaeon]